MSRVERHQSEYEETGRRAARDTARSTSGNTDPVRGADNAQGAGNNARGGGPDRGMDKGGGKGNSALGKFLSFIGTVIMIASVVVCLGLALPRFAGISQYVVISGSMEPAIPVGSLVYAREADPASLDPGDVIVFYTDEHTDTPVTHRVVENHQADQEVITKGDANAQNDLSPVIYMNIVGKEIMHIPRLGFLAAPLGSITGKIAAALIIVGAYLLTVLGARI